MRDLAERTNRKWLERNDEIDTLSFWYSLSRSLASSCSSWIFRRSSSRSRSSSDMDKMKKKISRVRKGKGTCGKFCCWATQFRCSLTTYEIPIHAPLSIIFTFSNNTLYLSLKLRILFVQVAYHCLLKWAIKILACNSIGKFERR